MDSARREVRQHGAHVGAAPTDVGRVNVQDVRTFDSVHFGR